MVTGLLKSHKNQESCPLIQISMMLSCRHAFGAGLDVEQRENLLLRQAQRRRCAVLLDQLMKELTFLIQDLSDALFDRAHGDKARHKDGITLADAVRSV